jgi:hypothetical protein
MGFDNITQTAAALFGRVLEEGPPTTKVLHGAWDGVLAELLRRYPEMPREDILLASAIALGRWEARCGCLRCSPSSGRIQ